LSDFKQLTVAFKCEGYRKHKYCLCADWRNWQFWGGTSCVSKTCTDQTM